MEPIVVAGAIAATAALTAGAIWAAVRYARPAKGADEPVETKIVEDEHPATFHAGTAVRAAQPARPVLAPPPPGILPPRPHAERAPAMVLTRGVEMEDAAPPAPSGRPFVRAPAPRPPMREPPPMRSWAQQVRESTAPEVPTEWARRQVGPVEPGRTSGACGGCGARLSVSSARPLRIACPVCGRTKLLAS